MTTSPPGADVAGYDDGNEYTRIIVDEAVRRGVKVTIVDASLGEMVLEHDGTVHHAFESLSDLTSAVAFRRCDDKWLTRRVLAEAGLSLPEGRVADGGPDDEAFLHDHSPIVVKPARGEGGRGVTVGVETVDGLRAAVEAAAPEGERVLLEAMADGVDLRIVVIGGEVVAASVRRPPVVVGDGESTIRTLVERRSEQRQADTGGASRIPLDAITESTVRAAGHGLDDVLDEGVEVAVRKAANLHTGGTIHDVTDALSPALADVARRAAAALDLPVLGLDLMVDDPAGETYAVIEANEQPGLANHEPRPTAQRYLDLLFPATRVDPDADAG